jgi:hypothetical protein
MPPTLAPLLSLAFTIYVYWRDSRPAQSHDGRAGHPDGARAEQGAVRWGVPGASRLRLVAERHCEWHSGDPERHRAGSPRQFEEMNEKRRCSTLFHLLVPGGK